METTTIVVIVILLMALGIFIGTQISGNSVSNSGGDFRSVSQYPSQYGGGGCGR